MSMFNKVTKSFQWGPHQVVMETGEIARQSTGAVYWEGLSELYASNGKRVDEELEIAVQQVGQRQHLVRLEGALAVFDVRDRLTVVQTHPLSELILRPALGLARRFDAVADQLLRDLFEHGSVMGKLVVQRVELLGAVERDDGNLVAFDTGGDAFVVHDGHSGKNRDPPL